MAIIELKVPDIGDFKNVDVAEILIKPGDSIALEQSLITIETDNASMEIPANQSGGVRDLGLKVGDKVSMGSVIAWAEVAEGAPRAASPPAVSSSVPAKPAAA